MKIKSRLDGGVRGLEESDRRVLTDVKRHGCHIIYVPEDDEGPGFGFTIGLHVRERHPEILVSGLPLEITHGLLNHLNGLVRKGRRFAPRERVSGLLASYDCVFLQMKKTAYRDFLGTAMWFYEGAAFPALQLVWPDRQGRFPWEKGGANPAQVVLGRRR